MGFFLYRRFPSSLLPCLNNHSMVESLASRLPRPVLHRNPSNPRESTASQLVDEPNQVPAARDVPALQRPELMAPAGDPEAAFAAFHFGAMRSILA